MIELVDEAKPKVGSLEPGRKYCFKIPGVLGGEYGGDNLASLPLGELIGVSGSIAQRIRSLPEGSAAQFRIVE